MLWTHTKSLQNKSHRPRRRNKFPSWSWAGWAGEVEFEYGNGTWRFIRSLLHSVRLELESTHMVEHVDNFFPTSEINNPKFQLPRALHLDVWVVAPEAFALEINTSSKAHLRVGRYNTHLSLLQDLEGPTRLLEGISSRQLECIVLGEKRNVYLMVLQLHKDYALRAGIIK